MHEALALPLAFQVCVLSTTHPFVVLTVSDRPLNVTSSQQAIGGSSPTPVMGKKLSKKQMRNAATKEAFRLAAAAQAEKKKKKLQQDYVPIKAANQQKQADALKMKGGCVVVVVVGDALCAVVVPP